MGLNKVNLAFAQSSTHKYYPAGAFQSPYDFSFFKCPGLFLFTSFMF